MPAFDFSLLHISASKELLLEFDLAGKKYADNYSDSVTDLCRRLDISARIHSQKSKEYLSLASFLRDRQINIINSSS